MITRRKFLAGAATICVAAAMGSVSPPVRGIGINQCILVIIVIVIGVYVLYKLIKFCRTYLGTNPPPPGTISNIINRVPSDSTLIKLPPLSTSVVGTSRIKLESGTDFKHWSEELTYDVSEPAPGAIRVTASKDGVVVMDKTVAVEGTGDDSYALVDFSRESPAFFPAPKAPAGFFRLLSTEAP